MRTLTPEELQEYANQYQVSVDLAQRDYVACRVAHAICSDDSVAKGLVFKGGFVLRLGHGSPRTSKDIDGTIGTKKQAVDPDRLQRVVRSGCRDLWLRFSLARVEGSDSLDFGILDYAGPLGPGKLALEFSLREDLLLPRGELVIDAFDIPAFKAPVMALPEMVAEKWRCLIQRAPRRPGDPYDLWFLWTDVRHRTQVSPEDELRPDVIKWAVPKKITLDRAEARTAVADALAQYRPAWRSHFGVDLPDGSPSFEEIANAVQEAARAWTPWS